MISFLPPVISSQSHLPLLIGENTQTRTICWCPGKIPWYYGSAGPLGSSKWSCLWAVCSDNSLSWCVQCHPLALPEKQKSLEELNDFCHCWRIWQAYPKGFYHLSGHWTSIGGPMARSLLRTEWSVTAHGWEVHPVQLCSMNPEVLCLLGGSNKTHFCKFIENVIFKLTEILIILGVREEPSIPSQWTQCKSEWIHLLLDTFSHLWFSPRCRLQGIASLPFILPIDFSVTITVKCALGTSGSSIVVS